MNYDDRHMTTTFGLRIYCTQTESWNSYLKVGGLYMAYLVTDD